ncbi:MAG: carbohydrate ABC transporter permease [Bacillati bacterium ANGP1]|uniref:Carbohydrate ABC transporter permease n=1 Tax=Candidatus Segetimicrobium genomatis TaxID=2569760 RepID=A0A537LAW6_9BACT|nr:MAG: carbohydrate ABC transporter permease [Terrabacteria group bacterium ANGP1]
MKQPPSRQVWLACMGFLALLWLLPLYTMLANSLKTIREIAQSQYVLPPSGLELRNYVVALGVLRHGLVNSTLVALPATALAVLLGSWAGFFLSRLRFRYSQTVFFAATIATFLPYQIVLIPLTQLLADLRLINTRPGLIVAYVLLNTPMAALITATFFQTVPAEMQEAAALDGCGPVAFYWRILLPVAQLGLLSTAILIFTTIWNEFLIPTAMTQGTFNQLATPVLAGLKGNYAQLWHIQMAGATLTSLPPLVIFVFLGRYFVSGLMAGTLK